MSIEGLGNVRKIQCEDFGAEPMVTGDVIMALFARTNAVAIQEALTRTFTLGGGTVTLHEPGTYYVSAQLTMYSNSEFQLGAGVILRGYSTLGAPIIVSTGTSDVLLTGPGKIIVTAAQAPSFTNVTNLTVDIRVEDEAGDPIDTATSGSWINIDNIVRLRLVGTGGLSIDAKDSEGNITIAVDNFSASGATDDIAFPGFPEDTVALRFTPTGTLQVTMLGR